jgi:hypothetical protein
VNIDDRVEALVREALDAAVKNDRDRFGAALAAIGDGETAAKAIELVLAICAYTVLDTFDGGRPTPEQIDSLAGDIATEESWAKLSKSHVAALLTNVMSGERQLDKGLPPNEALTLPFIVAANLLASNAEPEDGRWWFDYLDTVEERLEAAR